MTNDDQAVVIEQGPPALMREFVQQLANSGIRAAITSPPGGPGKG